MNQLSFAPILDRKLGDYERPKPLPQGSYVFVTKGVPRFDRSTQKKTEFVEFTCIPQGPAMNEDAENLDVDQEALDECLTRKDGEKVAIQSKAMRLTFYLTEISAYRLSDFMMQLGFGPDDDARQVLNESMNRRFIGYVTHTPSDDGQVMYANITRTSAYED